MSGADAGRPAWRGPTPLHDRRSRAGSSTDAASLTRRRAPEGLEGAGASPERRGTRADRTAGTRRGACLTGATAPGVRVALARLRTDR